LFDSEAFARHCNKVNILQTLALRYATSFDKTASEIFDPIESIILKFLIEVSKIHLNAERFV
jgi:hypothetical protein